MKYDAIKQLIEHFETFEQEEGLCDIPSFAQWLSQKYSTGDFQTKTNEKEDAGYESIDGRISAAFGALNQHARHYVKTALKDTELKGIYDYTYLSYLVYNGDMRKSDLINSNMNEFSPGMEIIRRLLRKKLISDYNDPNDGRSKMVSITEDGKNQYYEATKRLNLASKIVPGQLNLKEKQELLFQLRRLLHFHEPIWYHDYGSDLEDIIGKYVQPD